MKFNIVKELDTVSICMNCNASLNSFIDIYVGDEPELKSPFKTVEGAELFAKWVVIMLKVITNDIE